MESTDFLETAIEISEPVNTEQRCPVVFVLDRSGSMNAPHGNRAIDHLNKGVDLFYRSILEDYISSKRVELSIVAYDNNIQIAREFSVLEKGESPPVLQPGGSTKTCDAVFKAIDLINERKNVLKSKGIPYYRPYIILLTDGRPDGDQNTGLLKEAINKLHTEKKIHFWAFGVGPHVDMEMLHNIKHEGSIVLEISSVDNIANFFKWLSSSMKAMSNSKEGEEVNITPKEDEQFIHKN